MGIHGDEVHINEHCDKHALKLLFLGNEPAGPPRDIMAAAYCGGGWQLLIVRYTQALAYGRPK